MSCVAHALHSVSYHARHVSTFEQMATNRQNSNSHERLSRRGLQETYILTSCRKAIQQKVAEHKQAQAVLKRTKPWRLSRQSLLIDVVFTQMLSGHEFLYVLCDLFLHV